MRTSVFEHDMRHRCLAAAVALALLMTILPLPFLRVAHAEQVEGPLRADPRAYEVISDDELSAQSMDEFDGMIAQAIGATNVVPLSITLDKMARLEADAGQKNSGSTKYTYEQIRNALDPKNNELTVFADLRTTSGLTASQIDAYIDSVPKARTGMLHGQGAAFIEAEGTYHVNAAYLVAHAILETGWGTSDLARGFDYDGSYGVGDANKKYPAGRYYNFFGIGAYDSSPISGGRSKAVQEGWNSPRAAVLGGAEWIAYNYVHGKRYPKYPQPTLYAMMWDYPRANGENSCWHQYCTGLTWHTQIANLMDNAYAKVGIQPKYDYIIPQYGGETALGSNTQCVYRLYNTATMEHLYTTDWVERASLETGGWRYEGVDWYAPKSSSTPVYRICNVQSGEHLYTRDENEKNVRVGEGWRDEGIAWYSDDNHGFAVRRHFNPAAGLGAHHYTSDENESRHLINNAGWADEGISWYGL